MKENSDRSVLIVGGGFSGAALSIQLAKHSRDRMTVVIVEPSAELGRGVAYSTRDASHRVNVPTDLMALSQDDTEEATRWFRERGLLADPNRALNGDRDYVSRYDYGTFVSSALSAAAAQANDRLELDHRTTMVKSIARQDGQWLALLEDGNSVQAGSIALCFGHSVPRIPFEMGDGVLESPKFVSNPWANNALSAIRPEDSVLVVGTGLTMVDVVLSLRDRGHSGHISAVSRHGLTPRPHGDFADSDGFLDNCPLPKTAMELLRAVRRRIKQVDEGGWRSVGDALSAKLPRIWGSFPAAEKARAIRRLLPFWDVHRFRIPPYSHDVLKRDAANGTFVVTRAGANKVSLGGAGFDVAMKYKGGEIISQAFDAVVVCTGPDKDPRKNGLVASLLQQGVATLDDTGFGIAVDEDSRVIGAGGLAQADLFAFGPMTRSSFGEMSGANDIAAQIERVARDILVELPRRK